MATRQLAFLATLFYGSSLLAFCGFFVAGNNAKLYNNASQAVLVRQGNRTVMTISNNYQGPPENFALVVPVPVVLQKEDVKTLPSSVFDHIDQLSAPRLVEYWEQDPCQPRMEYMLNRPASAMRSRAASPAETDAEKLGVKIEAQFVVGEYQIVILSAKEASGLDKWLRLNKYAIADSAATALAPYVREQSKFFVAKIDITKVHRDPQGTVVLSPLRFGFPSDQLRLPVRLGLLNAKDKQDLIVYVLSPSSRYEVANYRNVFVPTNLEVANEVRSSFAPFYAQLFDATLAPMNNKAVVTEYAWQTTSCDPCPTPPLTPSDLVTLGANIPGMPEPEAAPALPNPVPPQWQPKRPAARAPQGRILPPGRPPYFGDFASWVLTRLHARYDKSTLGEDLIFREAGPIVGGRAQQNGTNAGENAEPKPDSVNNFQARYIIRHYWEGGVACQNPVFDQWGGPPGGGPQPVPFAAKGLASAPRGKVELKKVVYSPVAGLGLTGRPAPERKKSRSKP